MLRQLITVVILAYTPPLVGNWRPILSCTFFPLSFPCFFNELPVFNNPPLYQKGSLVARCTLAYKLVGMAQSVVS